MTNWDARTYDQEFAFVAAYGVELLDWLRPQPGEKIIDLGCGTGELTARLVDSGADVLGLDADQTMIDAARQRLGDSAELRVVDAHDFSVEEPVDAVVSNAALHWMPAPVEVLGCVSDALRPDGRFVAEMGATGNVSTIMTVVDQACRESGLPERRWPWYFPSPAEYAAMLEDTGLEIRQLDFYDRPTKLTGPDGLQRWLEMFASDVLADMSPGVLNRVVELARPELWHDGAWWADYRRLRFRAVKLA
ncbi:methyltransferase domain-containing protein [Actinobacteria bacterium YIM 96077]|uniref:SAM-dependent methyltransferase n=1 Tax=Phytoactinopolyspora halophila TaxID=1981511 RepID=A0A329QWG2_9ACTN|nr:methyltransferase domain-containing protein [Phytoactinopolyspora halophila]AYY15384.1 methyltransferase domain-containing protein [Actinobacteria bacterium YIM 96077]RAW16501.1 SAM-dependent methyltransferase [Phytoactinopolyspora halophila]